MEVEMKMVKSLLLGTAAGLVAVAGAQAADMPVKAKPVLYVKICSLYGDGYYYIPNTNTCIKIGGFLQVQSNWNASGDGQVMGTGAMAGSGRQTRDLTNDFNYRVRAAISFDVRDQTEYGTLRSYIRIGMQVATPANTGATTSPSTFWDRAFMQFAGFTVGRQQSFFDLYTYGGGMSYHNVRPGGDTGAAGVNLWAYTAQFGNGWSASLSLEDPTGRQRAGTTDVTCADFFTRGSGQLSDNAFSLNGAPCAAATQFGFRMPSVILNTRVDQAWGFVGASVAMQDVSGGYWQTPNNVNNGHPADRIGWAAAIGGLFNLPGGDQFGVHVAYAEGAVGFTTNLANFQLYRNSNLATHGWIQDAVFGDGTNIELTRSFAALAGYQHIWSPKWRTSLYGGYAQHTYSDTAKFLINQRMPAASVCRPAGSPAATIAGFTPIAGNNCSPDVSYWEVGTRTQWNPVPLLDIGLDIWYTRLNTAYKGPVNFAANGSRPICTNTALLSCNFDDQDVWGAIFRWQRNFYP
jgi:Porin subfamily